jgi:hypothetical protein
MNRRTFLPLLAGCLSSFLLARIPGRAAEDSATDPYAIVKKTDCFTVGGVGFAGIKSRQEVAFRQLLEEPQPLVRCQKLLGEATLEGKLYGLLGLRLLDEQAFRAALPRFTESKAEVSTMRGCAMMHMPAARLAKEMEKGELK